MSQTQLRVPVLIDRERCDAYKAYSELTGVPVLRIVREALDAFRPSLKARIDALEMQKQFAAVGK